MEVYCILLDKQLHIIQPTQAKIIDADSFNDVLATHSVVFFGDGAAKCKAVLGSEPNAFFPEMPIFPSAKTVGLLATLRFEQQQFEDIPTFEPYYLKDFMTTTPKKRAL
jgi:tRNA threonylcarbamoyladenosine biosynthesis protein TsaB